MKQWLQNLTNRERFFIRYGTFCLGLILIYFLCWLPFYHYNFKMREEIAEQKILLHWLQAAQNDLKKIKTSATDITKITSANALLFIDKSLTESKLRNEINNISQVDQNKISILFNKVSFDSLITWLKMCWETQHIFVNQIHLEATAESGIVKTSIELSF